nr:uncharacterized protein LOC124816109 [Hydra vulgaris]
MNKIRYTADEALTIILEPCSDSEMSDLEDSSDDDIEISKKQDSNHIDNQVTTIHFDADIESENTTDVIGCTKNIDTKNMSKFDNHVFRWRSSQLFQLNTEFLGTKFSLPLNVNTLTPLNYFEMFWKHEINKHISDETNLYSVQKTSQSINTTVKENEQFIVMHIYVLCKNAITCNVLGIRNKISSNCRYHFRNNCILIEPEVEQSIDEQVIPAKTKRSGIRQYNPKKPTKWGFKNYVRSGASGFMLFSDNWFSSLQLCLRLKEMGFLVTSTIRSDRIENCSLPTEKDLKKSGRGSHAYKTDVNSNIVITKWFDNKCVHMCSNYVDPKSVCSSQRWHQKEKKFVTINFPEVVRQ